MKQWLILYRKEMLEMWRNYKLVWVPIVFILLGVMQPVTTYYMPQILVANGLPQELINNMPTPSAPQVLVETMKQYGTLGILILVLSFMGTVANEKQSGAASLVLVKPVSYFNYITAKWCGLVTVTIISLCLGFLAAWYYTGILIDTVLFSSLIKSFMVYSVWLTFIVTITLFYSSIMKANGAIAFLSIVTVAALSLFTSFFDQYLTWSPSQLSHDAGRFIMGENVDPSFWPTLILSVGFIILLVFSSIKLLQRKDLGESA